MHEHATGDDVFSTGDGLEGIQVCARPRGHGVQAGDGRDGRRQAVFVVGSGFDKPTLAEVEAQPIAAADEVARVEKRARNG